MRNHPHIRVLPTQLNFLSQFLKTDSQRIFSKFLYHENQHHLLNQKPYKDSKNLHRKTISSSEFSLFITFTMKTLLSHVNTLYGKCLKFKPPYTEKLMAPFGRQAGLSVVISFNETDWTSGWNHLLKGGSSFMTHAMSHDSHSKYIFRRNPFSDTRIRIDT